MATLKEILCSAENRSKVIRDTVSLVEQEVGAKGGLSGIALKAGYAAVKAVKPGLITETVDTLLERFIDRVEPFFGEWDKNGRRQTFDSFLSAEANRVANALLGVTDERARSIANTTIRKTYEKLRPYGEKNVIAAVPALGRLLARYIV